MASGFVVRHTKRKASAVPMDQALEKAYNKPAKNNSGIVGISRRKVTMSMEHHQTWDGKIQDPFAGTVIFERIWWVCTAPRLFNKHNCRWWKLC